MRPVPISRLPPREREIAEIIRSNGIASAAEVRRALADPISDPAVRSMLTRLQAKGVLRRHREGKRFLYAPAAPDPRSQQAALHRLSRDHFGGCLAATAAALRELLEPPSQG